MTEKVELYLFNGKELELYGHANIPYFEFQLPAIQVGLRFFVRSGTNEYTSTCVHVVGVEDVELVNPEPFVNRNCFGD